MKQFPPSAWGRAYSLRHQLEGDDPLPHRRPRQPFRANPGDPTRLSVVAYRCQHAAAEALKAPPAPPHNVNELPIRVFPQMAVLRNARPRRRACDCVPPSPEMCARDKQEDAVIPEDERRVPRLYEELAACALRLSPQADGDHAGANPLKYASSQNNPAPGKIGIATRIVAIISRAPRPA